MLPHDLPRLWDWLTGMELDAALFSDPDNVCYITGYASQTDASFPFKGCPILVLVVRGQAPAVLLPCTEESDFRQASWLPDVSSYANYEWRQPVDIVAAAQQATVRMMQDHGVHQGTVGMEMLHLPTCVYEALGDRLKTIQWRDIAGGLANLRAIKTPEELLAIRHVARLCDAGQAQLRALIEPGKSEIAIFSEVRAHLEQEAGQRIHVAGDLVTGKRSGRDGGGLPCADCLERGDLVISDIVPHVNGWWADSCATIAVGEPSAEQKRLY